MKKIEKLFEIENIIRDIENEIDKNCQNLMMNIRKKLEELEAKYSEIFKIIAKTKTQLSIKFYNYEFIFTYMNGYYIPKYQFKELQNEKITINYRDIAKKGNESKYYCGYISVYMINPRFDSNTCISVDRIYINKDYDIALQGKMKHTYFSSKNEILKELETILINMFNRVYDISVYLPENSELTTISKNDLNKSKIQFLK